MAEINNNRPADEAFGDEKENRGRVTHVRRDSKHLRKTGRFSLNLFDILIIFVVLVIIALSVIGVRMSDLFNKDEGRACTLQYELTFLNVDEALVTGIQSGDALYNTDTKAVLGYVVGNVQLTPHTRIVAAEVQAEDGTITTQGAYVTVPERYDMTVTIISEDARYVSGEGYLLGGHAMRIGMDYSVRFPGYVGSGYCATLQEISSAS